MNVFSKWVDSLAATIRKQPLSGLEDQDSERNRSERILWVSGYPISGNSYIAYVITYVLNSKYRDVDSIEWSPQRVPLKKYLVGTNPHPGSEVYDRVLKTHGPPSTLPLSSDDKVLYIVRNVHDVANSYFHRIEKSWSGSPAWKHRFVSHVSKCLIPRWLRYRILTRYLSRHWAAQVREVLDDRSLAILKYEQFMESPLQTLEKIILHLDPTAWNEEVALTALDLFSFNNMKAAAKQAMPDASKRTDRVGGSGDYLKHFSPADIEWFEQKYHSILSEIDSRAWFGPTKPPV